MSKCFSASSISLRQRSLQGLGLCLLLSMLILLLGGGVALLWDFQQGSVSGRAAGDLSVVGPPSLSATTVDAIFARLGSPMVGSGKVVEQASRQTHINDAFAMGVWWTETNDGAAGVGLADRNPGSVRGSVGYPSAFDGYTIYPSYSAAIVYWFGMLRNNYVNRGLSSVYAIARPYVGTGSYPLWAGKVINLMYKYRNMAPPPPAILPTPKPKPKPTVSPFTLLAHASRQPALLGLSREATRQRPLVVKKAQLTIAPGRPRPVELALVFMGLLAAMAITLYSLKLRPQPALAAPLDAISSAGSAPTTEELSLSTDDLSLVPQLDFPPLERRTEGLILARRAILLPTAEPGRVSVAAPRPAGLLSRYRENSSQQGM